SPFAVRAGETQVRMHFLANEPGTRRTAQLECPERRRLGSRINEPKVRKLAKPDYPDALREEKTQAEGRMEVELRDDGTPTSVRLLSSQHPALTEAAARAVLASQFQAGQIDRQDVPGSVEVSLKVSP